MSGEPETIGGGEDWRILGHQVYAQAYFGMGLDDPRVPGYVPASSGLSLEARRTAMARKRIELGIHPTGRRLRETPEFGQAMTCGDCVHCYDGHRGKFKKCDLGKHTQGPATDIRARWPACIRFERSQ